MKAQTLLSTMRNVKLQPNLAASRLTCQKFLTSRRRLKEESQESPTDLCKYSKKMESHMLTCGVLLKTSGIKLAKFKDRDLAALLSNLVKFLQEPPTILETPCSQQENTIKLSMLTSAMVSSENYHATMVQAIMKSPTNSVLERVLVEPILSKLFNSSSRTLCLTRRERILHHKVTINSWTISWVPYRNPHAVRFHPGLKSCMNRLSWMVSDARFLSLMKSCR